MATSPIDILHSSMPPVLKAPNDTNGVADYKPKTNGFHSAINGDNKSFVHSYTNEETSNGVKRAPRAIAICGMAMRLPGGIRDGETFWDVLVNGKDTRGPIPPDRYNSDGFTDKLGKKGAIKTKFGYFLNEDLTALDTSFFTMSKKELERTDPQQRQILEVTREALENSGEIGYRGKSIGCYVGNFAEDWLQMNAKESQHSGGYIMTGHGDLMLANRVSYEYDLKGPSMVIKTGCSASLVGLHEACRALQNGDCTGAIVAGANMIMGPATTAAMTEEGILSPEGSCKTFDVAADGYARGDAVTAIYIKLLDDAIRDNNPVRAIIRNTGTNSDGKSQGLMTPNPESQESLIRKVYGDALLNPSDTAFVECHGTGTSTGDPIEAGAVGNVFGARGVYIGSVKPNVGHSEGASGITSLIKAVLALEHGIIPPNIKFNNPNPKIQFEANKLVVPVKAISWPKDRARRISINSFGIGGSNAHVVLDGSTESSVNNHSHVQNGKSDHGACIALLSANSQDSLHRYNESLQEYILQQSGDSLNLAYTLALHREHLPYRCFKLIGNDNSIIETSASVKVSTTIPEIIMVFSGQGAQWPEMGRDILLKDPEFRKDIAEMDQILQSLIHPPSWTLAAELQAPPSSSQIHRAELAQPLCTAVQIALVRKLKRNGVEPDAVVGHSSGEIAAAYASGAISLAEAIISAYYRGFVTKEQKRIGGMGAVGLGVDAASKYLKDGVIIACDNSPNSVTLSGDADTLDEVFATIRGDNPDVLARRLKVDMAYHSDHMKLLGSKYHKLLVDELQKQELTRQNPKTSFFSSVVGKEITNSAELGPEYWVANLTSMVRFNSAISRLQVERPNGLFLEIGPHSTLSGPLRQISAVGGSECRYVPTMLRGKPCTDTFLSALGQLYQNGITVDWDAVVTTGKVLTNLPRYAWDHTGSFWYEPRVSKEWRFRQFGHHRLLGLRIPESSSLEPLWRNMLTIEDEPWLGDHRIRYDVVFPFAGYIAMAGEAVRQLTGIEAGYRVKHAVAQSALVIQESQSVEVLTSLRLVKLGDVADSTWFEFRISSYNGSTWVKHCEGQIKACTEPLLPSRQIQNELLPRKIISSRWYQAMDKIGVVYGPNFQALQDIVSSTKENLAAAKIVHDDHNEDPAFLLHPVAIDNCLQLLLVALAKGIGRDFGDLRMPTIIEDLYISNGAAQMNAIAWSKGFEDLAVECIADGRLALQLKGLKLTPMDNDRLSKAESHAAARLEWLPDFNMIDHAPLFTPPPSVALETRMQEEMTLLCILESAEIIKGVQPCQEHFSKFRDWLDLEIDRAKQGTYPLLEKESIDFVALPSTTRKSMIEDRYQKLLGLQKSSVAIGIKRIYDNMEAIFSGSRDTLDILMQDDVLTEIYNAVSFGKGDFFRLMAHTRPNLRILEVGAGTGGTTEMILRNLIRPGGHPPYSLYTFTDISAGFFTQGKERFSYAPNMDYKVFDISQSPINQGFEAESYDVVLAPNVIHATPSLNETLMNLQLLLKPGGLLVLTELCAVVRTPNYIFGNFSGWWLGEEDGRPQEPYVSVERWDEELKRAGFSGVDTAVRDAEEPYHYCAAIVSRKLGREEGASDIGDVRPVTIICEDSQQELSQHLLEDIQPPGMTGTICQLGELPPADQDLIILVDLAKPFFECVTESRFSAFQDILNNHKSGRILWATNLSQVKSKNPRSAQVIGIARSIRAESAIPFYTLEIDSNEPNFSSLVKQVLDKIRRCKDTEILAPDKEYVVDEGVVKIGRYQTFSVDQDRLAKPSSIGSSVVKSLEIALPGSLDSLSWTQEVGSEIMEPDKVEIENHAVGINFKDVLYAMGVLKTGTESAPLGLEIAGVVRRVGSAVQNLAVGDRVLAMPPDACFKTLVTVPQSLVERIPFNLSFEEAATMPIVYTTVIECLINIGMLEKGQSVLIHSAAGGIGHAAINVCRMLGAEIYCTVGNDDKVRYLMEKFDIPRHRIFNSRNDSFANDLMRETGGRGVDLVLNSLSGELLHASWNCVAEFGKMIEIGKKDMLDFGKLQMNNFMQNRSYCCVDMTHLVQKKPQRAGAILGKCVELYEAGHIPPIHPISVFEASAVRDAFGQIKDGTHIGKVVVSIPQDTSRLEVAPRRMSLHLDGEASYLLTGGLGGLGKPIATWLVEHGARSLIFISRSAGKKVEDQEFFRELESSGCSVSTVAGFVESMEDVQKAIGLAPRRIAGVIHLAMILRDAPIASMNYSDWLAANAPKVTGAWNLHESLKNQSLDFFILASSLVTIVEQPGQGNYSGANTFLEAFCQYRNSLSLPASVLNICPIEDVGFVAENAFAKKNMKAQGLYFLGESELLDFMELAVLRSLPASNKANNNSEPWINTSQLVMGLHSEGNLNDLNTRTNWRRDRRMGFYHNISEHITGEQDSSNELQTFLSKAADDPEILSEAQSAEYLAREIGMKVYSFLMKPADDLDTSLSLTQIGLDSLMAIELRRWWKQTFGMEISVLEIMATGTLDALGVTAAESLRVKLVG